MTANLRMTPALNAPPRNGGVRRSLAAASMLIPLAAGAALMPASWHPGSFLLIGRAEAATTRKDLTPKPAGDDWQARRDALAQTVRGHPQDLGVQLAYAQLLTERAEARAEGFTRLALLARNPAIADTATRAWRQAVLSLPQDKAAAPMLTAFLDANPNDGAVGARLNTVRAPSPPKDRPERRVVQAPVMPPADPKPSTVVAAAPAEDDGSTLTRVTLAPGTDPIPTRSQPQVKVSPIGSRLPPSAATLVYADNVKVVDRGDDPSTLAVPPGYATLLRPTPLHDRVGQPAATPPVYPAAPTQAGPVRTEAVQTETLPPPVADTPVPVDQPVVTMPVYPGAQYGQAQYAAPQYRAAPPDGAPDPAPSPARLAANDIPGSGRSSADIASPVDIDSDPFQSGPESGTGNAQRDVDPMTQQIDRDILQLRDALAPSVQGGFNVRTSSGTTGMAKVTELSTPLEATYPTNGSGEIKLSVVPTALFSGSIGSDPGTAQRFGSMALGLNATPGGSLVYTGRKAGNQNAQGVGLDLGYSNSFVAADIGSSPLGFLVPNVVGGLQISPRLSDTAHLHIGFERRALNDSVLTYAGTTDPRTGVKFGGVVRNQGTLGVDFSLGQALFYGSVGGGLLTGQHVADNTDVTVGAGGSYPVYRRGDDEVRVGLSLLYLSYEKNLSFFTLGQGGYFSPQSYVSALVPVTYSSKVNDKLSYEVGAALGYQTFHEKSSAYYPADSGLQAQLNALAAKTPGIATTYAGQNDADVAGNVHGKVEYRVSPSLRLGAQASYQHSGTYDEAEGGIYARYQFNGPGR